MIVNSWGKVRSLMRSRRAVEVITEERGVRIQTVRRSGQPQTLAVPCDAGPMPHNLRDELQEATRPFELATAPPIDMGEVFTVDDDDDGDELAV